MKDAIQSVVKNIQNQALLSESEERAQWFAKRVAEDLQRSLQQAEHDASCAASRAGMMRRHYDNDTANTNPKWANAFEKVRSRLGTGFLMALTGPRGTGKTQMAKALIDAFAKPTLIRNKTMERDEWVSRTSAKYVTAMSFFMSIRATYKNDSKKSESKVLDEYSPEMCRLLIIDEVHERSESAWEDRLLTHLVDKRYGELADTLLISNLSPDAFEKHIGPSIASRMTETGGIIECDWESFRK